MVPSRLLDTRAGFSTIDCLAAGTGAVAAGSETSLPITGRAGIPGDATAVVLNVAVTDAQGPGFITAYPCGQPRPTAANLNYVAGSTVPNLVIAKIGAGGAVCLFSFAATQIIADVNGYFPAGSSFTAITPARVLETRPGYPGDQTAGAGSLGLAAGSTTEVQIGGRLGVPADAAGVALNVAAISPQSGGYITVFPCDTARPVASSLNYTAGAVTPNAVTAAIGAGGKVCIYTYAATHLAVDVNGYFAAGSTYVPLRPGRVADTRPGAGFGGTGAVTGGSFITVNPGMYPGGIPVRSAVVLNVAVTDAQAGGFVTAYPCDQPRPNAANLNYAAGQTVANEVIAKVAANGTVCLFVLGTTHVVVDLNGYFPA